MTRWDSAEGKIINAEGVILHNLRWAISVKIPLEGDLGRSRPDGSGWLVGSGWR